MTIPREPATGASLILMMPSIMPSVIGGSLIGLASAFNILTTSRITGVSGILSRAFRLDTFSTLFVAGVTITPTLLPALAQTVVSIDLLSFVPKWRLLLAGALIGAGARIGNGCTSGHGVCGLARRSKRSVAAVGVFFCTAVASATLFATASLYPSAALSVPSLPTGALALVSTFATLGLLISKLKPGAASGLVVATTAFMTGSLFATGLLVSSMASPKAVASFLDLQASVWNYTLPFVMASAIAVSLPAFMLAQQGVRSKPSSPASRIDGRLLGGAAVFGVGWGLVGVCPGPLLVYLATRPGSASAICMTVAMVSSGAVVELVIRHAGQFPGSEGVGTSGGCALACAQSIDDQDGVVCRNLPNVKHMTSPH